MRAGDLDWLRAALLEFKRRAVKRWTKMGMTNIAAFVDMLVAQIDAMPTLAVPLPWISADQALPPQDGVYLVCTRKGAVTTAHFYPAHQFSNGVCKPAEWQGNRDVAYWMPLPEPPELQPPEGAVRIAKLGSKRIWVDDNDQFVSEVD